MSSRRGYGARGDGGCVGGRGHAQVDRGRGGIGVELRELPLGAVEADRQPLHLAQPTSALRFGDSGDEVVADFHQSWALVGISTKRGTYLVISHGSAETFQPSTPAAAAVAKVCQTRTATPGKPVPVPPSRVSPPDLTPWKRVVWVHHWRPDPNQPVPTALTTDPPRSGGWAAVGKKA